MVVPCPAGAARFACSRRSGMKREIAWAGGGGGEFVGSGAEVRYPAEHGGLKHSADQNRRGALLDPGTQGWCDSQTFGDIDSGPARSAASDRRLSAQPQPTRTSRQYSSPTTSEAAKASSGCSWSHRG